MIAAQGASRISTAPVPQPFAARTAGFEPGVVWIAKGDLHPLAECWWWSRIAEPSDTGTEPTLVERQVRQILADFRPDVFDPLLVFDRGQYARRRWMLADGHRRLLAALRSPDLHLLPCRIVAVRRARLWTARRFLRFLLTDRRKIAYWTRNAARLYGRDLRARTAREQNRRLDDTLS